MAFERKVYSVFELTLIIRSILEQEFPLVWVKGEISNLSRATSGHIYFSLKDANSVISAVWFKSNHNLGQNLTPDSLRNGKKVLCAGKVSVYPQRGNYQLIVEFIEEVGIGELYVELEMLKQKLKNKGYFDESRKRPIPRNPRRVGVITAPSGAAIQDFLKVARERGMDHIVRIYPSLVQGIEAPQDIARMIEIANIDGWAEVLVLIRGGGSFEDIHVFNSEIVAEAIYKSKIPVVTGIGHEIDYTIADMVADLRLATPTYVADFLWDPVENYVQMLDSLTLSLERNIYVYINARAERLKNYLDQLNGIAPNNILNRMQYSFVQWTKDLESEFGRIIQLKENELSRLIFALNMRMESILENTKREFLFMVKELKDTVLKRTESFQRDIELQSSKINHLDPRKPLDKGFCYVKTLDGRVIVSARELNINEKVNILFKDGERLASIIN